MSAIAAELGCQLPVVVSALRKLAERGAVASRTAAGRKTWGTAVQIQRMDAARRQVDADRADSAKRIVDRNRDLEFLRRQLAISVAGRGIEVSSLPRMYPSVWNDAQIDRLIVETSDPEAARWLLGRISARD